MDTTTPERSPLAEALAKLDEAMRAPQGSSRDPDRRRVAARLSDLARCEDDELSAFAGRHLPGRTVDEPALRAARELMLAVGRVLGPEGESADALGVLADVHRVLDERIADAKKAAALREAEAAAASAPALLAPPAPVAHAVGSPPFVPAPAAVSATVTMTMPVPPPRPEPPARPAAFDPESTSMFAMPVRAALPFAHGAPEERQGRPVARLDTALPFQPVAGPDQTPKRELPPPAAVPGPAAQVAPPLLRPPTPPPQPEQARQSEEVSQIQPAEAMKQVQGFSLAQYAELCATVTAFPAHVVQIRGRYGMDVHAWTALHALWQERFQRDPTLHPRWAALVQTALSRHSR